ncbi:E3 ubiquitin-protein ligase RFWD3 [Taenia crassiceps]|uniref:RING-type E3 ubiquitin transferase n=1 Tax=Taenia crassiceps TaxID=6207 RepID=A0ABR4QQ69_9CEST
MKAHDGPTDSVEEGIESDLFEGDGTGNQVGNFLEESDALDTTDRDRALEDLEAERKLRRKLEVELSEYKFKLQLACSDAENLRDELNSLKAVVSTSKTTQMSPSSMSKRPKLSYSSVGSYVMTKTLNFSPAGQCRVLAPYDHIKLLCVSQASTNPLFKGFGIKKIHTDALRQLKFIHLHAQPIRDMAFHPEQQDAIIASASTDKSLKLTSLLVDQVVQTYQCSSPIWSCCWAFPSPNYLFAGCVNGSVYLFDIRVTSRPASVFVISASSTAPVIALQYISPDPSDPTFQSGGLLAGQLTQVAFLEEAVTTTVEDVGSENEWSYRSYPLSLEGSLVSLSSLYEKRGLFLASYRPSTRVPRVRHLCTRLTASPVDSETGALRPHGYDCESVASLFGGTQMRMLSRARLFRQEESDQILVASGDDDAGGALVWNCTTGSCIQTLTMAGAPVPVIDVCAFNNGGNLALLTDHQVDVFKWCQNHGSDT